MNNYKRTIVLIAVAIIFDFIGRLTFRNILKYVLLFEAFLFLIISISFFYYVRPESISNRKTKRLELVMGYFFLLGSFRAVLLILGITVEVSNLIIMILAAIFLIYYIIKKKS
ncbi:MAG: hypothetical protein RDU14_08425 [Melioribacteraceae bacterium]|nr:hypothetical protein [Melioribacteraceae bacterium]